MSRPTASNPDPFIVACPACDADVYQPCTAPTDTGRRKVAWTHLSRDARASEQRKEPRP